MNSRINITIEPTITGFPKNFIICEECSLLEMRMLCAKKLPPVHKNVINSVDKADLLC